MTRLFTALSLLTFVGPAFAQAPDRAKPEPTEVIPGYQRKTIQGFTVLINSEVLSADTAEFERKPLDVIELELKMVAGMMNKKSVDVLRRLPIWIEWKEIEDLSSGRPGTPVAVYYGGHQQSMLRDGKHPLKAKTITVLRMDLLTKEHQPKTDSGRCVMLHEMAHAVHDQLLGRNNPAVAGAYRQAMERKLYEKSLYAATNDAEFFAELTCAYFDQLHYFPRNRRELQDHDPVTFKLMETAWGKSASTKTSRLAAMTPLLGNNGADQHDLGIKLSEVQFGESVHGAELSADDLAGKVTVIASWGDRDAVVLKKLAELNDELGPYGVRTVVIAAEGYGADLERTKTEVGERPEQLSVVERLGVPDDDRMIIPKPPHALVFDPDGTCVFRGNGYDAINHARAAVGRKLVARHIDGEPPTVFAPAVAALTSGGSLLAAIPKLAKPANGSDEDTAKIAKDIYAALTAPGEARLEVIRGLGKADPLAAFIKAEKLAQDFDGTSIGTTAGRMVSALKSKRPVMGELAARKYLAQVQKLDGFLSAQEGGFDPSGPAFQARNGQAFTQMNELITVMKKKYPTAPATAEAEAIVNEYLGE